MNLYQFIVMKWIEHGDVAWENGITLNVVDVFLQSTSGTRASMLG